MQHRNSPHPSKQPQWSWIDGNQNLVKFHPQDSIAYEEIKLFFSHIANRVQGPVHQGYANKGLSPELIHVYLAFRDFLFNANFGSVVNPALERNTFLRNAEYNRLTAAAFVLSVAERDFSVPFQKDFYLQFGVDDLSLELLQVVSLGLGNYDSTEGLIEHFLNNMNISNPFSQDNISLNSIDLNPVNNLILAMDSSEKQRLIRSYFKDDILPMVLFMIEEQVIDHVPFGTRQYFIDQFSKPKFGANPSVLSSRQIPYIPERTLTTFDFN